MASILSEQELFFNSFEPKLRHRYKMYIDGVPAYMVRAASRPKVTQESKTIHHINVERYVKGKTRWGALNVTLYDPITPSGAQVVTEWLRLHHESVTGRNGYAAMYKKDIIFNSLGPIGDKVEEWVLKGCLITNIEYGDFAYDNDDPAEINLTIQPDFCVLSY